MRPSGTDAKNKRKRKQKKMKKKCKASKSSATFSSLDEGNRIIENYGSYIFIETHVILGTYVCSIRCKPMERTVKN